MVIDYKGVSFSFEKIRRKKRLKKLRIIGLVVVVILLYFLLANAFDSGKIKKIQTLLLENKINDASTRLKKIESSLFHRNSKKELKALVCLFSGEHAKAKHILDEIEGKSTSVEAWKFLNYFSHRARYQKLGIYSHYLGKKKKKAKEGEDLLFYNVLVKTGLFAGQQSSRLIEQLPPEIKKKNDKALTLIGKINDQLKSGKINYIFDIDGKPLACYDIKKKKTISLTPGINFDAFTADIQPGVKFYRLTLDRRIQEIIHGLFRDFNGTFLLMNISDSGIVAAYSKPVQADKKNSNTVFSQAYEPGSLIKLLTLFAYLQSSQSSRTDLFPFHCQGLWPINGQIFYDWKVHHRVENCEEALVVSCNIAFAQLGVRVGFKPLSEMFNRFYFNSEARTFTDLGLTFETGTYKKDIPPSATYRLANLSVGLDEISITTFHSALISAIISQNGSIYSPYLIQNKKNLLNIAFYNHVPQLIDIIKANTIFFKIKNAMRLVVEAPNGTGKRARVDVVSVALKTGTAGNKKLGLDAILTGFFPAHKPQYAFAFRLERAGKAEWIGTLFLKNFLTALYQDKPLQRGPG
ncbi:MAG: hypothetical protein JSV88_26430 [Candidatus Aminicenantes bacterium]|nr:MAG: hypothetical protein JSV88_26430 [Candidatus Aminicenantes bacterium]